jgi:MOSC domain-containing protein YiiM
MGRIRSVQTGRIEEMNYRGRRVETGIFKTPVSGPAAVGRLGLEGDHQGDLRVHGGPDKAVYGYPYEHYQAWANEYPEREFSPGFFGENLTLEGVLESDIAPGDRFRAGTALLEATTPRQPCYKLGTKFGDMSFVPRFAESGRTGFYFRVVEEGMVEAGSGFERV